jgi:hypothetical protein
MSSLSFYSDQAFIFSNNTLAVFQGEVGIVPYDAFTKIITPTPTHCTILTLFHPEKQVALLAHIDEYTSVLSTIRKIEQLLKEKFKALFKGPEIQATVMAGSDREVSITQNKELRDLLSKREINVQKKDLGPQGNGRPQLSLDSSGKLQIIKEKEKNRALEEEQKEEYGSFNDILDMNYGDLSGDQIPFFEAKEATRCELISPTLNSNPDSDSLRIPLRYRLWTIDRLSPNRVVMKSKPKPKPIQKKASGGPGGKPPQIVIQSSPATPEKPLTNSIKPIESNVAINNNEGLLSTIIITLAALALITSIGMMMQREAVLKK